MKIYLVIALALLLGGTAFAQEIPHLAYVYPAGGRAGSTFQITVGGQLLMTVSNALFTGLGISATVLEHSRPMNQKKFNDYRDRLKELQEKYKVSQKGKAGTNTWTTADVAEREKIRAQILKNPPNRKANPAMIDTVTIRICIATNAAPGDCEIRLASASALSNPLRFCVDTLPEISKPAAKPVDPEFDKYVEKMGGRPASAGTPKYEARVPVPAIVNGQIMPGGVDRYRFSATRGQQLIIAASARVLIPYLADAVPGWFEAVLTIYDSKGKELASEERFRFRPDPVIHFAVPSDGEYTVEIHDSIFRGREDFVYRLAIGELPFVTGIFPLGGKAGEKTPVTLTGWNLPQKSLSRANTETGLTTLTGNFINNVPFLVNDLPEVSDREPNDSLETAQAVTLPVVVNGHISRPGERDIFKFKGHAGQQMVAEIFARRLNSPLDSFLRLTDADGKQLAFNDDNEDKGSGLETHHADSYLTAALPADGTYFIHLTDTQGQGGPDFAYRLRLGEPQPDFALRVVPSSLSLRAGMSASLTVLALRRDGFTNAINLDLKDAPAGFSLSGAHVAANQDKAQFTLKAPADSSKKTIALTVTGHALVAGKLITHTATPAEDMMQAFIYRHLVPSQELAVTVEGQKKWSKHDTFKILSPTPAKIPRGGTVRVRVSAPWGDFSDRIKLEPNKAPEGISLKSVTTVAGDLELLFASDATLTKPGTTGNLICSIAPKKQGPTDKKKKPSKETRVEPMVTLPAIPYIILAE
jgi:hypothetical protein